MSHTRRAVSNACIFVESFNRRKEPQLSAHDRAAKRSNVILPRERLLRIRRRIINRKARVQRRGALVECPASMPVVGAMLGRDDNRCSSRSRRVRVLLRSPYSKFLDRIGREILQETADVIVGVVAPVNRELDVEARAAARRYRRDARLRGIGRLDGLRTRRQISHVCEAPLRKRNRVEILFGNCRLMNRACRVDWLGGNRRRASLDVHALLQFRGSQRHGDVAQRANWHVNFGSGFFESLRAYGNPISARTQIVQSKGAVCVRSRVSFKRRSGLDKRHVRTGDARSG